MPLDCGTEVGLGPGHIVLDGDPVPSHGKGHSTPTFAVYGRSLRPYEPWPMSIVAKRLSGLEYHLVRT